MSGCVRTSEQIAARMEEVRNGFLDFQSSDLLEWLPYDLAKPHLKAGVTAEEWAHVQETGDPLVILANYLPFAWEKANDCRGLSAGRSVEHLKAWLWLAGYDLSDALDEEYDRYGKPCLVTASTIVGFPWRDHDNGEWVNKEDGPRLNVDAREQLVAEAQRLAAQGTEAREGGNSAGGSVHESPVGNADAPNPSTPTHTGERNRG